MVLARALVLALVPAAGIAATGEEIYKGRCSLCHDGGAGQAPRISRAEEWTPRLARGRQALIDSAIRGVPGTPMTAKGGHVELSDAEVALAVAYILDRSGATAGPAVPSKTSSRKAPSGEAPDDAVLIREVGEAIQRARVTGVRVDSVKAEVTLQGMVNNGDEIRRAEEAAYAVPGVARVVNNLISAAIFEFD
ncbi:MAG: hypothetical protein QOD26_201 [Betaproteobacteria bacterium]|jgi:cytochrome c5|nr:hypothetical protein [Betaproteobacteria bacterium]